MHLYLWKYECKCGNTFKFPGLDEIVYGEFLLHNHRNESRYLYAIGDVVFAEVSKLIASNDRTKDLNDGDRATILHSIFGVACDKASDGSTFKIGYEQTCSVCGTKKMKNCFQIFPFEVVEKDVQETTYHEWNSLSEDEKFKLIDKAICEELSNPESDINTIGSNGSLIKS